MPARPDGQRQIQGANDLSQEEIDKVVQMIKTAVSANHPGAVVDASKIDKVFSLVFTAQWDPKWPASPPVEKERPFEDASIQIGVWKKDLPATSGQESGNGAWYDSDPEVNVVTPRKRPKKLSLPSTKSPDRVAGAPVFIRPWLRDCGIIDISFTDRRGDLPQKTASHTGAGGSKIDGSTVARAVSHYEFSKRKSVNEYNRSLLVYFIRRYVHELVTGKIVGGGPTAYKYAQPVLISHGLQKADEAWAQYQEMSRGQQVDPDLLP